MANFKTFTNASTPYEGKKIAIDMDRISCYYEDVLKTMKAVNIRPFGQKTMYGQYKKILIL